MKKDPENITLHQEIEFIKEVCDGGEDETENKVKADEVAHYRDIFYSNFPPLESWR